MSSSVEYDFVMKEGDRSPSFQRTLTDEDGNAVDLTDASVELVAELVGDSSTTFGGSATVETPASDGVVRYDWSSGDTDTPGTYIAEFVVTYNDSTEETFPNHRDLQILVRREV